MNIDLISEMNGKYVDLLRLDPTHAEITHYWRSQNRAMFLNKGSDSIDKQREWILNRPKNEMNFVISLKSGKLVGMISLININLINFHGESARFLIGDTQAAQGIPAAADAMRLLLQLAFDELKLKRIFGTIAAENFRMIKWQEFVGMKMEGRLRKHYCINNNFQDAVMMGLLEEEYRSNTIKKLQLLTL